MKKTIFLVAISGSLLLLFLIYSLNTPQPMQKRTRFMMDTFCTISVPGSPKVIPHIEAALDRMQVIDNKFNVNFPGSPLYRFANTNTPITDNEVVSVINQALDVCKKSNGAKDITLYPLSKLWGFYSPNPHLPAPNDIQETLKHIGYKNLAVTPGMITKTRTDIAIDLGSIAKGYAISQAAEILRKGGIKSAIIDGGGQIYVMGLYNGKPWKIGIKHPRNDGFIGRLEVSDMSIATSGDYERFFIQDGQRYHHLMDARTGYPAKGVMSATVMNPDPTVADNLTSAVFVLGPERGMALIKSFPKTESVVMTTDGNLHYSDGLEQTGKKEIKIKTLDKKEPNS